MNTLRNQRRISLVAWAQDFMNARKFGGNKSLSGKKKENAKQKTAVLTHLMCRKTNSTQTIVSQRARASQGVLFIVNVFAPVRNS